MKPLKKCVCTKNYDDNSLFDSSMEIIGKLKVEKYIPAAIIIGTRSITKNKKWFFCTKKKLLFLNFLINNANKVSLDKAFEGLDSLEAKESKNSQDNISFFSSNLQTS